MLGPVVLEHPVDFLHPEMCIRDRGKASDLHTKRQVYAYITKEDVAKKLFDEISRRQDSLLQMRCFILKTAAIWMIFSPMKL